MYGSSGALLAAAGRKAHASGNSWRYWRIYLTANNGDASYTSIQEIELAATAAGADLSSPGMTTADDGHYGTNDFSKAIDNNTADYSNAVYVTDGTALPHWGYVDLGSTQSVVEWRMLSQNLSTLQSRAPKDFKIQGSTNGSTWTDVASFTGVTSWTAGVWRAFDLINGTWA